MRTLLWIAASLAAAIYVTVAFATVDHSSDKAQIDSLISRGVQATQNRDLTTIVSFISSNYKDDALNCDQLRVVLAQALRNEADYTVHASGIEEKISGSEATVRIHVVLTHSGGAKFYDRDIILMLAKEDDHHMLVAPCKAWRVVGSQNLGLGVTSMTL